MFSGFEGKSPVELIKGGGEVFKESSSLKLDGFQNLAESSEFFANENLLFSGKKYSTLTNMYYSKLSRELAVKEQFILKQEQLDTLFINTRFTKNKSEKMGFANKSHFNFSNQFRIESNIGLNFSENKLGSSYSSYENIHSISDVKDSFVKLNIYYQLNSRRILKSSFSYNLEKMSDNVDFENTGSLDTLLNNTENQDRLQNYNSLVYNVGFVQRFPKNWVFDVNLQYSLGAFKHNMTIKPQDEIFKDKTNSSFTSINISLLKRIRAGLISSYLKIIGDNNYPNKYILGNINYEKNVNLSNIRVGINREFLSINDPVWIKSSFTNSYKRYVSSLVPLESLNFPITNNLNISYYKNFVRNRINLGGDLSISYNQQTFIQKFSIENGYSIALLKNKKYQSRSFNANLSFEKFYSKFNHILKLNYSFSENQDQFYSNEKLINSTQKTNSFRVYVGSSFSRAFNYRFYFSGSHNQFYRNNELTTNIPLKMSLENYFKLFDKKLTIINNNLFYMANKGQKISIINDIGLKTKLKKLPVEFGIECKNILNQKAYRHINENMNSIFYALYEIRPFTVLGSLKLVF